MKKIYLPLGLVVLLLGTSTAISQGIFGVAPCEALCDPCEPAACNPCDPCGNGKGGGLFSSFTFGGWVEAGVYTNSHSKRNNGPMHLESRNRNDFQMSQLYIFGEKEMNTKCGLDWGGRIDLAYGTDYGLQRSLDGTFDYNWGVNRSGYGVAAPQLYGTLGYKNLSVMVGKFATPLGWETVTAPENIFYSHSYCFIIEPATHSGVLGTYEVSDRLSLNAGWTSCMDASLKNRYNDTALLTGFTYALGDNATVYYWINAGKQNNGEYLGENRFGDPDILRNDYFVQSLCLEWALTERFTHVLQYNLRNDNYSILGGTKDRYSAYGINNHFLYKLTDTLTAGTRVEWFRDNIAFIDDDASDYWQVTLGLRWDATDYLSFRPEVRYDWCQGGATPFSDGTKQDQVSGGCGLVISF